jgi:hypothetical protein
MSKHARPDEPCWLTSLPDELLIILGALLKIDEWMRVRRTCVRLHAVLSCLPDDADNCQRWASDRIAGFKAQTFRQVQLAYCLDYANEHAKFVPCEEPPPEVRILQSLKRVVCTGWPGPFAEMYGEKRDARGFSVSDGFVDFQVHRWHGDTVSDSMEHELVRWHGRTLADPEVHYNPLTELVESLVLDVGDDPEIEWLVANFDQVATEPEWENRSFVFEFTVMCKRLGYCTLPGLSLTYQTNETGILTFTVWNNVLGRSKWARIPLGDEFQRTDEKDLQLLLNRDGTLYMWKKSQPTVVVCYRVC